MVNNSWLFKGLALFRSAKIPRDAVNCESIQYVVSYYYAAICVCNKIKANHNDWIFYFVLNLLPFTDVPQKSSATDHSNKIKQ